MNGVPTASVADIAALAHEAGLRRVHVLAWRDLVDIEAGGSEVHAGKILALWAEAGLEVVMRTSYAQGHPYEGDRDGYHIVRKHGRFMVFPTAVVSELLGGHGPRDGLVEIWNGVPFLTPLWARGPRIAWVHHVHRDMWDMVLDPGLARAGKYDVRVERCHRTPSTVRGRATAITTTATTISSSDSATAESTSVSRSR